MIVIDSDALLSWIEVSKALPGKSPSSCQSKYGALLARAMKNSGRGVTHTDHCYSVCGLYCNMIHENPFTTFARPTHLTKTWATRMRLIMSNRRCNRMLYCLKPPTMVTSTSRPSYTIVRSQQTELGTRNCDYVIFFTTKVPANRTLIQIFSPYL
jgi:hypothetical protein